MSSTKNISQSEVVKIFSDVRQYLEKKRLKQEFQHLNFFCNWMFHTELSGSSVCYNMLVKMTDLFLKGIENDTRSCTEEFVKNASCIFSIETLRIEFISVFKNCDLPLFLFNQKENWLGFLGYMLEELSDKPIKFPDNIEKQALSSRPKHKSAARAFRQIERLTSNNQRLMARELEIIKGKGALEGSYCWQLRTEPQLYIQSPINCLECNSTFGVD